MRAERAAPAIFVVLWSTGFAFVALGLPDSEPITFLALRYLLVVALLAAALAVLRPPLPARRREWVDLVVVALLVQTSYFVLLYLALDLEDSAATVALVVSLQPILVALLAPRFAGEHVGLVRWAGLVLGLAGAALVIVSRSSAGSLSTAGLLCAVAALGCITAGTLYETRFGGEHHPVSANLIQYGVGVAVTLPLALALEGFPVTWTTRAGGVARLPCAVQLAGGDHAAADDAAPRRGVARVRAVLPGAAAGRPDRLGAARRIAVRPGLGGHGAGRRGRRHRHAAYERPRLVLKSITSGTPCRRQVSRRRFSRK